MTNEGDKWVFSKRRIFTREASVRPALVKSVLENDARECCNKLMDAIRSEFGVVVPDYHIKVDVHEERDLSTGRKFFTTTTTLSKEFMHKYMGMAPSATVHTRTPYKPVVFGPGSSFVLDDVVPLVEPQDGRNDIALLRALLDEALPNWKDVYDKVVDDQIKQEAAKRIVSEMDELEVYKEKYTAPHQWGRKELNWKDVWNPTVH